MDQALRILAEMAERSPDPEQQALYQQALAALRQRQAADQEASDGGS